MSKQNLLPQTDAGRREEYNKYYMHVSSMYRIGKWVLLLLFALYLTVMLIVCRDSITYENFLYLTRNLQMPAHSEGSFSSVVYEEQQNMSFAAFKGELAVAGSSQISFYDSEGTLRLQDSTDCIRPILLSGNKYLMMYDEGGTSYSLYTTIGRVWRTNAENSIQCAAINDQGVHAIAVRSQDSKYCVALYDSSFRELAKYYRDTYVTGLALQSDGELLAILSIATEGSSLQGAVTIGRVGADMTKDVSLGDQIPLAASFMQNGTLAIITDGAVLLLDAEGALKCSVPLSAALLSYMSFSNTCIVVACSENTLGTLSRVLIISEDGTIVGERAVSGKISSVTAADGLAAAYIQSRQEVFALSKTGELTAEMTYTGNLLDLCIVDGRVVFCFAAGAQAPKAGN